MNTNKQDIYESVLNLYRKERLNEGKEIQRVLPPADADAFEQHEEAQAQNAKRRDPKNYEKEIKELIDETASEESRYRHFDVVDRKDLAKKINEARQKGLPFKVSRSNKEGFRYDLKVLNESLEDDDLFLKKEAGDPDINTAAFNKATNVGASSPSTGLGEDYHRPKISGERLAYALVEWLSMHEGDVLTDAIEYLQGHYDFTDEEINSLFFTGDALIESVTDKSKSTNSKVSKFLHDLQLKEDLTIYTTSLKGFIPSKKAEKLWNQIKEADKIEDLEYSLETLYPDGISDVALDNFLSNEKEWVRNMLSLPELADEDDEEEIDIDVDDEDIDDIDVADSDVDDDDFEDNFPLLDDEEIDSELDDEDVKIENDDDWGDPVDDIDYFEGDIPEVVPMNDEEAEEEVNESITNFDGDLVVDDDDVHVTYNGKPVAWLDNERRICHVAPGMSKNSEFMEKAKAMFSQFKIVDAINESITETTSTNQTTDDDLDSKTDTIADSFLKNNYKPQTITTDTTSEDKQKELAGEALKESEEDDEVVDVDDTMVDSVMGFQTKEEDK